MELGRHVFGIFWYKEQDRTKFQLAIIINLYWSANSVNSLHMLMIKQITKCLVALIIDWKFMKIGSATIKNSVSICLDSNNYD